MSATTDLAFERLSAVGAIPVNTSPSDAKWERARQLIDMAYEQVIAYLAQYDVTTAAAVDALSANLRGVIATVLAEMAASRLQYNAAPSTEGYIPEGLMSSLMAPRHKRALDMAFRGVAGDPASVSIVVTRDEDSSWLRPYDLSELWS